MFDFFPLCQSIRGSLCFTGWLFCVGGVRFIIRVPFIGVLLSPVSGSPIFFMVRRCSWFPAWPSCLICISRIFSRPILVSPIDHGEVRGQCCWWGSGRSPKMWFVWFLSMPSVSVWAFIHIIMVLTISRYIWTTPFLTITSVGLLVIFSFFQKCIPLYW